jgi:hypothetical protein
MAKYDQKWIKNYYIQKRTWTGFVKDMVKDGDRLFKFFFGFPLAVGAAAIVLLWFRRRQKLWHFILALLIILGGCAAMVSVGVRAHYFASITCLVILIITYGLRFLSLSFPRSHLGDTLLALLMAFQLALNILATPIPPAVMSLGRIVQSSQINRTFVFTRQKLKDFLLRKKGEHLVIIRYFPGHRVFREWVYNDADIDRSPIVWARDMGADKNAQLLQYFKDRQVWYVEVFWDLSHSPFEYDARY